MTDTPAAIASPAATLVIFRERDSGPPELLMVERARAMVFAGGALVFPGGRVDPGDHTLAAEHKHNDAQADALAETAARIAAIRETIEEAGIPIGLTPPPSPTDLTTLRKALHAGDALGAALASTGTQLTLAALEPFARWRPAHTVTRNFDTRFYLARLPEDAPLASVDATENVRLLWATAQHILDEADAGRAQIIFPTRRNLERLARFSCFDDAVADARAYPIRTISPWEEDRDGVVHLCIPDDLGYPVTSEPMSSATRG